jgi:hypothetical protein
VIDVRRCDIEDRFFINQQIGASMQIIRAILSSSVAVVAALVLSSVPQVASAQASRTWVSGVGDDANPCSRTAPCKTFAGAISKTATNGEINCIDPGGFGAVTITKSIVIDCTGVLAGVLNAGTNGIIVNAGAGQVTLRHLSIDAVANGSGQAGIRVLSAASVQIDQVIIRGQTGNGIDVLTSASTNVTVTNSVIRENAGHGIWLAPTGGVARLALFNSTSAANGLTGIRLNDNCSASVSDSLLTGNGTSGVAASSTGGSSTISLDRVVSSGNRDGGVLAKGAGAIIWLANTLLSGNSYGFFPPVGGGSYVSFGNNRVIGNTTSDGVPSQVISQL